MGSPGRWSPAAEPEWARGPRRHRGQLVAAAAAGGERRLETVRALGRGDKQVGLRRLADPHRFRRALDVDAQRGGHAAGEHVRERALGPREGTDPQGVGQPSPDEQEDGEARDERRHEHRGGRGERDEQREPRGEAHRGTRTAASAASTASAAPKRSSSASGESSRRWARTRGARRTSSVVRKSRPAIAAAARAAPSRWTAAHRLAPSCRYASAICHSQMSHRRIPKKTL